MPRVLALALAILLMWAGHGATMVDGTYPQIEIRFKAFVGCELIPGGGEFADFFNGNSRDFSYDGAFRTFESVTVTVDPANPSGIVAGPVRQHGIVQGYDASDVGDDGSNVCQYFLLEDAEPICEDRAPNTRARLDVRVRRLSDDEIVVLFWVSSNNPCAPGSCGVDARMAVFIRQACKDGVLMEPEYRIRGRHDGFPWYEIYIDDVNIIGDASRRYEHDPILSRDGLSSLCTEMDEQVDTGYVAF